VGFASCKPADAFVSVDVMFLCISSEASVLLLQLLHALLPSLARLSQASAASVCSYILFFISHPCEPQGCKNMLILFPEWMSYSASKPGFTCSFTCLFVLWYH